MAIIKRGIGRIVRVLQPQNVKDVIEKRAAEEANAEDQKTLKDSEEKEEKKESRGKKTNE